MYYSCCTIYTLRSFECMHLEQYFIVISHGVGAAGAAICFEELIHIGAKVILRAGTCGSLQPATIRSGDVVVLHSAVREEGPSALMIPQGFPAVASPEVYQSLLDSARRLQLPCFTGMTVSSDLFYKPKIMGGTLDMYSKANVEVVEMEVSTLFVMCYLHKVRTGALCVVDGSPLQWDQGNYDPTGEKVAIGSRHMIKLSLDVCSNMAKQYKDNTL
eukprot:GHVQ01018018.1.p1 GENE.GHVQ01018018.1~~GHVQ01018018.1.p1  ORF type:complete len:216 (+),score=30.04 GHVQ01018018.1:74-721(+)